MHVARRALVAGALVALVALASACGDDPAPGGSDDSSTLLAGSGAPFSTTPKQGKATYYDYSGADAVACGFDITSDTDVTALPDPDFAESAACGACVDVTGPKGKVTVRVVDLCPDCEADHIDLSAQAFAKIADPSLGRVAITYRAVACSVTGPMSYRVKEGSSEYWTAIQIRNHRLPIAKLEYMKDGAFRDMPRESYNYFVDSGGVGKQPSGITLRITAVDGQVVTDTIPGPEAGQVFAGAVQFK